MIETASLLYCKPEVPFAFKQWDEHGKTILEIIVKKSTKIPHYAPDNDGNWKAYVRVEDQNLLANPVLLKVWKKIKLKKGLYIKYTEKEKILLEWLEKNKEITISKFCKIAHITQKDAENILSDFIVLDIIEMKIIEKQVKYLLKNFPNELKE